MRSVNTARFSILGIATVSLALVLTGCGAAGIGGPSKSEVAKGVSKELDSDPDTKGAFPKDKQKAYADCVADVLIKKGNKDEIKAWLKGSIKIDDIRGVSGKSADADFEACAKKVA